jgi:thiamine biosynthesis lipoprotein
VIRVDHRFASMGGIARVTLESAGHGEAPLERHAGAIRAVIEDVEAALSRFRADSDLTALNRDPRPAVPASPLLRHLALAVRSAGARSGGLVDATLLGPLERQGYTTSRAGVAPAKLDEALAAAITVPPGIRYAISCGGDLAVGGALPTSPWEVAVRSARTGAAVHRLRLRAGSIATSGISTRLWRRDDGTYAHHLIDPSTGEPAWTGLVAVTAVAATALDAEVLAKTAMLSGPARARTLLGRRGGVLQHDDGRVEIVARPPAVRLRRPRAGAGR